MTDNDEPEHIQFLGPTQPGKSQIMFQISAKRFEMVKRDAARQALLDAADDLYHSDQNIFNVVNWLRNRADSL